MTRHKTTGAALVCLALSTSFATSAWAQATPVAAPTPAPVAKAAPAGRQSAAVEQRITDLHTRLKITPAEQKPFDDFAQVMRDNAKRMDGLVKTQQDAAATSSAIEQMERYNTMAQAHAEDVQHLTGAFTTLYGTLSADQKKMADESFRQFSASRRGRMG